MDQGLLGLREDPKEMEYDLYLDENPKTPRAYNRMDAKVNELLKECPYKTVVFDTVTNLTDIIMNRVTAMNGRGGQTPQLQDYFVLTSDMKQLVYRCKAWPCHVLFIAHEHVLQDDNTGVLRSVPLTTTKLASRLPGMFNEVYYTDVIAKGSENQYRILTGVKGYKKGKTQLGRGKFDLYMEPDFESLMAKLESA